MCNRPSGWSSSSPSYGSNAGQAGNLGPARPPSSEQHETRIRQGYGCNLQAVGVLGGGILEAGGIEEGIQATMLLGEYVNDPARDHGTPMQRHAAFMTGYNSGVPASCDTWLLDSY